MPFITGSLLLADESTRHSFFLVAWMAARLPLLFCTRNIDTAEMPEKCSFQNDWLVKRFVKQDHLNKMITLEKLARFDLADSKSHKPYD